VQSVRAVGWTHRRLRHPDRTTRRSGELFLIRFTALDRLASGTLAFNARLIDPKAC